MNPTDVAMTAWGQLTQVSARLVSAVEGDLKRANFPPLIWYNALSALQQTGADGLRQFQLGNELALAQYNLSRLCDRLEETGYIAKAPCPVDSRGLVLMITTSGSDLLQKMQPVYSAAIQTHFAKHLSGPEIVSLSHLLNRFPTQTTAAGRFDRIGQ